MGSERRGHSVSEQPTLMGEKGEKSLPLQREVNATMAKSWERGLS
jgi:hypothetical protein